MRYPFSTYGLRAAHAEAMLQFGAWKAEGGRWFFATIAQAMVDRDHLERCGRGRARIVRVGPASLAEAMPSGRRGGGY